MNKLAPYHRGNDLLFRDIGSSGGLNMPAITENRDTIGYGKDLS
jgi:hypothetical protein